MPTDMNALIRQMQVIPRPPAYPEMGDASDDRGQIPPSTPIDVPMVDPRDRQRLEDYPYDSPPRGTGQEGPEIDPRFIGEVNRNPNGAEAGPLYLSPEAQIWMREIIDAGFSVDWGTNTIFNPDTGEEYPVPTSFPKMM